MRSEAVLPLKSILFASMQLLHSKLTPQLSVASSAIVAGRVFANVPPRLVSHGKFFAAPAAGGVFMVCRV
jgi:hypothetical protein